MTICTCNEYLFTTYRICIRIVHRGSSVLRGVADKQSPTCILRNIQLGGYMCQVLKTIRIPDTAIPIGIVPRKYVQRL